MKILYLVIGLLTLGLGCVGVALPILPTTPFLLVAAFCFAKSSNRLNDWFKSTNLYKTHLDAFAKGQGMRVKTKVRILSMVTLLLGVGAYCMRQVPYGIVILGVVWVAHIIAFVFVVKTQKEGDRPC